MPLQSLLPGLHHMHFHMTSMHRMDLVHAIQVCVLLNVKSAARALSRKKLYIYVNEQMLLPIFFQNSAWSLQPK